MSHYISPSWTSSHSPAVWFTSEPNNPLDEPYVNPVISRHSASPVSPRATVYQHYLHLDILRVLGPQWATGATKWIIHERSRSFLSLWVLSELQEPLYITSCRYRHFMNSGSPVSHRSHCMNHRYIDVFAGFLCPQWAVGATIWTTWIPSYLWVFLIPSEPQEPLFGPHVDLHSGSLVIPVSQYISPPCISSHSQTVLIPSEP